MKISRKEWCLFILIALLSFVMWLNLGYRQFSFVNLSLNRGEALSQAEGYLRSQGIETQGYFRAIVFSVDVWGDRYLQKTLGYQREEDFIKRHGYELFYWRVRFFKEFQKEEYILAISPKTGEVLSFRHLIDDIAHRPEADKESAKALAKEFLKDFYKVHWPDYSFHEEKIKRFENRIDYTFSWEKKNVYVPWKEGEGGAKLLLKATVSGNEVTEFYKNNFVVPEKFRRHIENQLHFGEYLYSLYFIIYTFLLSCAVYIIIKKRQDIISRFSKPWFISLAVFLVIINLISLLNNFQRTIFYYPTSVSLASFVGIFSLREIIHIVFLSVIFVLPGIAGESLRAEVFPHRPYSAFTRYLRTTFYSRSVLRSILFGYILFFIILGTQSGIFYIGQRTFGVWKEWHRLTQLSSAFFPFLSAFAVSITASLNEEVTFRLFGISLGKKYLKNTALAILFTSLIWGAGHSTYAVFPVWFRVIEVSILGLIYGMVFIRYGLLPLIVSHYVFDVFFGMAGYLLGEASRWLFIGAVFVLSIPLLVAFICYLKDEKEDEKESQKDIKSQLTPIQKYNLSVLITFVSAKKSQGHDRQAIREELITHDWDRELVDLAVAEVFGN